MRIGAPCWAALFAFALAPLATADELALYFGAPGGTVTLPAPALDGEALTVELRIKTLEKLQGPLTLVAQWDPRSTSDDKGAYYLELGPGGKVSFGLRGRDGTTKVVTARGAWRDLVWQHLACTWDGHEAIVYANGQKVASERLDGFGPRAASALPVVIGSAPDAKGRVKTPFEGFVSDVAIWSKARDADAFTASAKAPLAGDEAGLAAHLPLREAKRVAQSGSGTLSQALAGCGWCRTHWWFADQPDAPYVHVFTYDPGLAGASRAFLVSNESRDEAGVLVQDASGVRVVWSDLDAGVDRSVALKALPNAQLLCGASDALGNVYYLMVEARGGAPAPKAMLYLSSSEGRPLKEAALDTARDKLDVWDCGGEVGSMAIGRSAGCLLLPRRMHTAADGLNHQGAIGVTFSLDLAKHQSVGSTSSHSHGNALVATAGGEFLGVDLGDNYPRGVNLHRISGVTKTSRVVFTYKAAHETTPGNGKPVYEAISGGGRTYYQWSNDNNTYTELGGVLEGRAATIVIVATERSPEGLVLDNRRVGSGDARDLAMFRVVKGFNRSTSIDDLLAYPGTGSKPEVGGYFDYGGRWAPQRVVGVLWLTQHAEGESAHAPQLFHHRDGAITILWEKTGGSGGASLYATRVDETGKSLGAAVRLDSDLRLVRNRMPRRIGKRLCTLAQDGGAPVIAFLKDE